MSNKRIVRPTRVFLDSTVHIFAFQAARTNSSLILSRMDGISFQPVISYKTVLEVQRRVKELAGKDAAGLARWNLLMLPRLKVVSAQEISELLPQYAP